MLDELRRGRAKLQGLFGDRLSDILVPPWNRIDADLVRRLPSVGFSALSTFGPSNPGVMPRLNSDLDIIDWRNGRIGRPRDDLARKLAEILAAQDRIGILTHHLAHDATAWASLESLLVGLLSHPAVLPAEAGELLAADLERGWRPAYPPTRAERP